MPKLLQHLWLSAIAVLFAAPADVLAHPSELPTFPLSPAEDGSAYRRWLAKPVQRSVVIDDVESIDGWETRGAGKIELAAELRIQEPVPLLAHAQATHRSGPAGNPPSGLDRANDKGCNAKVRTYHWVPE